MNKKNIENLINLNETFAKFNSRLILEDRYAVWINEEIENRMTKNKMVYLVVPTIAPYGFKKYDLFECKRKNKNELKKHWENSCVGINLDFEQFERMIKNTEKHIYVAIAHPSKDKNLLLPKAIYDVFIL